MTTLTTLQDNKKHPPHPMQHFNMHPSMSTITASPPDINTHHPSKLAHRRRDSGELDVFEAARYFSDGVDCVGLLGGILFQRTMKQEEEEEEEEEDKRKLEIAMKRSMQAQDYPPRGKQSPNKSSRGGRLASFVNSLFHQKASKEKSKPIISSHEPKETEDYEAKNSDWINGDEEEEEYDGSSDSSSDLFELKSYDLKDMPKLEIIKRKDSIAR